jgi:hypothetical protein
LISKKGQFFKSQIIFIEGSYSLIFSRSTGFCLFPIKVTLSLLPKKDFYKHSVIPPLRVFSFKQRNKKLYLTVRQAGREARLDWVPDTILNGYRN